MSHQNVDNQKSTESDEAQQNDQNELCSVLSNITLETTSLSPIFKVNIDCWEEIFDWLSMEDVHSFGQTCKRFYRLTGVYSKWKYKRVISHVYDDSMTVDRKDLNGFNEFSQRLSFYSSESDTSLHYALAKCKSPIELEIVNARTSELDIKSFEKWLSQIEIIKFINFHLSNEFFESFLKLCVNLKRLTIDGSPGNGWMQLKYPKLQHLCLSECNPSEDQDLKKFFEQNLNVRSFSTTDKLLLRNRDMFMTSSIDVDDLKVFRVDDNDLTTIALIDLHERGFYKRLHFTTYSGENLMMLPELTTLHVKTYDYIKMPALPTVTGLIFKPLWNGLRSWMDMDEVSMALVNLERIFTEENSAPYMLPFIRNSAKLKELNMEYLRYEIDVVDMNNERKKLKGARKMTIHLEERDYIKLKWKYNGQTDFGLIELKRKESYDGIWDYY